MLGRVIEGTVIDGAVTGNMSPNLTSARATTAGLALNLTFAPVTISLNSTKFQPMLVEVTTPPAIPGTEGGGGSHGGRGNVGSPGNFGRVGTFGKLKLTPF